MIDQLEEERNLFESHKISSSNKIVQLEAHCDELGSTIEDLQSQIIYLTNESSDLNSALKGIFIPYISVDFFVDTKQKWKADKIDSDNQVGDLQFKLKSLHNFAQELQHKVAILGEGEQRLQKELADLQLELELKEDQLTRNKVQLEQLLLGDQGMIKSGQFETVEPIDSCN